MGLTMFQRGQGNETIDVTQTQEQKENTRSEGGSQRSLQQWCYSSRRHLPMAAPPAHGICNIFKCTEGKKSREAALCDNWFKADLGPKQEIRKSKTC